MCFLSISHYLIAFFKTTLASSFELLENIDRIDFVISIFSSIFFLQMILRFVISENSIFAMVQKETPFFFRLLIQRGRHLQF